MANNEALFEGGLDRARAEGSPERTSARVQRPERKQLEWRPSTLDDLLASDHRARLVWAWTELLDLSPMYERIGATETTPGRPAIDPRILLALWLFATLEGVGSARALDRLCKEHIAYLWICGGVGVNRDALAAFRRGHEEDLDALLSQAVAAMMAEGLVEMKCVAQDGMRVRASAGQGSLRSKKRLRELEKAARKQVQALKRELEGDNAAGTKRCGAARERVAKDRHARLKQAMARAKELEADREDVSPSKRKRYYPSPVRVSTTDPEARKMRMGDGGFRVAYNAQLATDVDTHVIVGVDLTARGTDAGELGRMAEQVRQRFGRLPKSWLADAGFTHHADIERLACELDVYVPPQRFAKGVDPSTPRPRDSSAILAWKHRMASGPGQALYRKRLPVAEGVNAQARNRGLTRFPVRGRRPARAVLLMYALAHNMSREWALRAA